MSSGSFTPERLEVRALEPSVELWGSPDDILKRLGH